MADLKLLSDVLLSALLPLFSLRYLNSRTLSIKKLIPLSCFLALTILLTLSIAVTVTDDSVLIVVTILTDAIDLVSSLNT